jgi:hypothetical protein
MSRFPWLLFHATGRLTLQCRISLQRWELPLMCFLSSRLVYGIRSQIPIDYLLDLQSSEIKRRSYSWREITREDVVCCRPGDRRRRRTSILAACDTEIKGRCQDTKLLTRTSNWILLIPAGPYFNTTRLFDPVTQRPITVFFFWRSSQRTYNVRPPEQSEKPAV